MATSGRGTRRVAVLIDPDVWTQEVERLAERSPARVTAERERRRLENDGINVENLERCADEGSDRTRLAGLLKVYLPIRQAPPSQRPFGMVFLPADGADGRFLVLMAFGERHPRPGRRSVYERAHKRLHGRYPDQ